MKWRQQVGIAAIVPILLSLPTLPALAQNRSYRYQCEDNKTFQVDYQSETAEVTLGSDHPISLDRVRSGSGARYSNGEITLYTKGNAAFIEEAGRRTYSDCIGAEIFASAEMAQLSGIVSYRQRIALPDNAIVTVKLQEVSRLDAPAVTIAEQSIPTAGRQVPIPFELTYDPSQIEPRYTYVVRAEISIAGERRWINSSANPVITHGNPSSDIEVEVEPIRSLR